MVQIFNTALIFRLGNRNRVWPDFCHQGIQEYRFSTFKVCCRTILDPSTGFSTGHFHEKVISTAPKICPGLAAEHLTLHSVFTDGTAVVEDSQGKLAQQEIDCIDRKLIMNEVTNPAAVTCKIPVNKCCALDEVLDHQEKRCVRGESLDIRLFKLNGTKHKLMQIPSFIDNHLQNMTTDAFEEDISSLNISDQQALRLTDVTKQERFCVETVVDGSRKETKVVVFPDGPMGPSAPVLFPEIPTERGPGGKEECSTTLTTYTVLGCFSIISLIVMILVYLLLPELRNHHGLIVVSCAFSTLLATLFLVIVYNFEPQLEETTCGVDRLEKDLYAAIPTRIGAKPGQRDSTGCKILGFFGVFSNLSMFTWMSVMCWDLARTFGRLRPPSNRLQSKKFLYYSAFGWLLPLLFTIFCLILQQTTPKCSASNPSIGTSSCFVDNENPTRRLVFFHLPMLLLLLSNVAGFAFCLYHIRKTQRGARTASDSVETR